MERHPPRHLHGLQPAGSTHPPPTVTHPTTAGSPFTPVIKSSILPRRAKTTETATMNFTTALCCHLNPAGPRLHTGSDHHAATNALRTAGIIHLHDNISNHQSTGISPHPTIGRKRTAATEDPPLSTRAGIGHQAPVQSQVRHATDQLYESNTFCQWPR